MIEQTEEGKYPHIHEALRRLRVCSASVNHWTKQFKENPTDANAVALHLSWVHMREAVDAVVAIPSPIREMVALAATDAPEGT